MLVIVNFLKKKKNEFEVYIVVCLFFGISFFIEFVYIDIFLFIGLII